MNSYCFSQTKIIFLKEIEIQDLLPGNYLFFVRVRFEEDVAQASSPFNVVAEPEGRVPAPPAA